MDCSFCHGTSRENGFVTLEDFRLFCKRAEPFTDHVYLHVMGEPLLHPQLAELIDAAAAEGLRVSITTNGTLIKKRLPLLLEKADKLYKISVSLHSFEANSGVDANAYFDSCFDAAKQLGNFGVISVLRLWNLDGLSEISAENAMNGDILARLKEYYPNEWQDNRSGQRIGNRVYLEWGERFDWPDMDAPDRGEHGFCYALKDHIAVLIDGSVVPCCLDADGVIALGNLKEQELGEILESEKARLMLHGFENHALVHPLCRRCGFARKW